MFIVMLFDKQKTG